MLHPACARQGLGQLLPSGGMVCARCSCSVCVKPCDGHAQQPVSPDRGPPEQAAIVHGILSGIREANQVRVELILRLGRLDMFWHCGTSGNEPQPEACLPH